MITKSNKNFEIIYKKHNQKIQEIEKELKKNEEYFNDYEKNRAENKKKLIN